MDEVPIFVSDEGDILFVYHDDVAEAFRELGYDVRPRRASHVEPAEDGTFYVDLAPSGGPRVEGWVRYDDAVAFEVAWITRHMPEICGAQSWRSTSQHA